MNSKLPTKSKGASTGRAAERQAVRAFMDFLSDRRVLFNPDHVEVEDQVTDSVFRIRERCTDLLSLVTETSPAVPAIRAIRAACRHFLDSPHVDFRHLSRQGFGSRPAFFTALGEFRAAVGVQIAFLAHTYRLEVENELATILPPNITGED